MEKRRRKCPHQWDNTLFQQCEAVGKIPEKLTGVFFCQWCHRVKIIKFKPC